MGMAASQARLLSLTARLHDVELKAQSIMSQKIALATQKDALYQEYCEALDATAIKVAYMDGAGGKNFVDANYSTLCGYNKDRYKQYALRDNRSGNVIVSKEVQDAWENYGNDKYAFAYAMMGFECNFAWEEGDYYSSMGDQIGIGTAQGDYGTGDNCYMTQVEQIVYNEAVANGDTELAEKYQAIEDSAGDTKLQREALTEFRDYLYSAKDGEYAEEIFNLMNINKNDDRDSSEQMVDYPDLTWDKIKDEFNYYVRLWETINDAGGCQVVDPQYESGEQGNEWFNNMVESGLVSILVWDDTGSSKQWSETSVATSTNNNYLQEVQDDTDLKKAEAEYEHELDIINRKDTKFDTDLSKLETERKAITTEIDSIKTVKDENIDRTFRIFS